MKKQIYYLAGIGGIGLSSLAMHLHSRNYKIFGSDKENSKIIQDLKNEGIDINLDQNGKKLEEVINENGKENVIFIYSNGLPNDNLELKMARKYNLKLQTYPEALGNLIRGDIVIAICGTHGKSTTTAMIAKIMLESDHKCNVVIGTKMKELKGKNYHVEKDSPYWVIEADEYKEAFLHYNPRFVILPALEPDHLDYYKTPENYYLAFSKFFSNMPKEGVIITHKNLLSKESFKIRKIDSIIVTPEDNLKYELPKLKLPGEHLRNNAKLALLFAQIFGIGEKHTSTSLSEFNGTWRRFEILGKYKTGSLIITDYAHTPTEIDTTLKATREGYPDKRIICIFEPHQASRLITQFDAFTSCFDRADIVLIPSIYYVRDNLEDKRKVTPEIFIEKLKTNYPRNGNVKIIDYEDAKLVEDFIDENTNENDVIMFIGAGPIDDLARELLN